MKIKSKHLIIYLISFLLAFVVTVQIRTVNVSEADILRLKKENELRDEVNQWKDAYDNSTKKIEELNNKINEYQKASASSSDDVYLIINELNETKVIAGLSEVSGKGITVVVDDKKALEEIMLDAGYYDSNVFLIHDNDIMKIINELVLNGAEAISVNGQRITSLSGIKSIGPVVEINGVKMSAPFEIKAIGDSDTLSTNISLRGGIINELRSLKIDIKVTKEDSITIPAYDRTLNLKYSSSYNEEVVE